VTIYSSFSLVKTKSDNGKSD